MRRAMLLMVCLLPLCGACRPGQMELALVLPGDGGCPPLDLTCANYLQFKVTETKNNIPTFTTHCVQLTEKLHSLCDLQNVAIGQELFKLSPDSQVSIEMRGMRVYPAWTCDYDVICPPHVVFKGTTGTKVYVSEKAGGILELPVEFVEPCGGTEYFFNLKTGQTCITACQGDEVACDGIAGGCLCKVRTQTPDAGR
jgi:hypothetical protein